MAAIMVTSTNCRGRDSTDFSLAPSFEARSDFSVSPVRDSCSSESSVEEAEVFIRRSAPSKSKKSSMDQTNERSNSFNTTRRMSRMLLPALLGPFGTEVAFEVSGSFESTGANLHYLASDNNSSAIREFTDRHTIDQVKIKTLETNTDGNTPAMVAALCNHKEALLALLGPFFMIPHDDDIDQLLHHCNANGQNLIAIVAEHMETLQTACSILVEFEAATHGWDDYEIALCFREHLGSTQGAKATMDLFKRIERRNHQKGCRYSFVLFVKIFSRIFILKMFFLTLDIVSDGVLLVDYYRIWSSNVTSVGNDACQLPPDENVSLKCFQMAISIQERFYGTLSAMLLPIIFYFFELLRFRTFSAWIESKMDLKTMNPYFFMTVFKPFKLLTNLLLLVFWPIVAIFRQSLTAFQYQSSDDDNKTDLKSTSTLARTIGSRAQIIEVCTESSLQPLLQLYLVLINLIVWKSEDHQNFSNHREHGWSKWLEQIDAAIKFLADEEVRRIASSLISILMVAASFTSQYRQKKDSIVSIGSCLIYFSYICLAIVARILCFEMFALYMGPGRMFHAIACVIVHVWFMSIIHFIFSNSLDKCKFRLDQLFISKCRQIMLVLHNCVINGLANIYIHNNLEIMMRHAEEDTFYHPSTSRKRTFVRQLVVDSTIFAQNIMMIVLAKDTTRNPFL